MNSILNIKNAFTKRNVVSFIMQNKALVIFIFIAVIMSFISEYFLTTINILNVIRQVSAIMILAVGFTLVLGSGNIDLSIGSSLGLLGIIMAMLSRNGVPFPIVVIIGISLGAFIGIMNAAFIHLFSLPPFIVTIATSSVLKGTGYIITKMKAVIGLSDSFLLVGQGYLGKIPIPIYIVTIVGIVGYLIANRTVFGRHAIASGASREAARASGVNIYLINYGVFTMVGICVAISSIIMTGRVGSAQIATGQGMEMDVIAAVVIGGTYMIGGNANIVGSMMGCLLVGTVNNMLNLTNVDPNYQIVAKGLLILFAVTLDTMSTKLINKLKV